MPASRRPIAPASLPSTRVGHAIIGRWNRCAAISSAARCATGCSACRMASAATDRDYVVVGETPGGDARARLQAGRPRLPGVPASADRRGIRAGAHRAQIRARLSRLRRRCRSGGDAGGGPAAAATSPSMRSPRTPTAVSSIRSAASRDIEARVLRHVGPAFVEDPLRVLRAARFMARFAPLGILDRTGDAGADARDGRQRRTGRAGARARVAGTVARARRAGAGGVRATLRACGALAVVLPEVDALYGVPQRAEYHPEVDTGVHIELVLRHGGALAPGDALIGFAALTHDLGKALTPARRAAQAHRPRRRGHRAVGRVVRAAEGAGDAPPARGHGVSRAPQRPSPVRIARQHRARPARALRRLPATGADRAAGASSARPTSAVAPASRTRPIRRPRNCCGCRRRRCRCVRRTSPATASKARHWARRCGARAFARSNACARNRATDLSPPVVRQARLSKCSSASRSGVSTVASPASTPAELASASHASICRVVVSSPCANSSPTPSSTSPIAARSSDATRREQLHRRRGEHEVTAQVLELVAARPELRAAGTPAAASRDHHARSRTTTSRARATAVAAA